MCRRSGGCHSICVQLFFTKPWKRSDKDLFVLLAPACSDPVTQLGDIGREWNVPVITSGGTDSVMDNKIRFSTLFRLAPYQQQGLIDSVIGLFLYYNWTNVAMICDDGATEFATFLLICKLLPTVLIRAPFSMTLLKYNFKINPDYRRYLLEASAKSRIFFISTHASRLRKLLAFVAVLPFASPFIGRATWRFGDPDDEIVRIIYRYLLFVSCPTNKNPAANNLNERIKNRTLESYGLKYDWDEEVTMYASSYYLGIQVLAQTLVSDNFLNRVNPILGTDLRRAMWNRTYDTELGRYRINANGDLDNEYGIKGIVDESEDFQVFLKLNRSAGRLFKIMNDSWPLNGTLPRNRPKCGYTGEDRKCLIGSNLLLIAAVTLCSSCSVVLLLALAGFLRLKRYQRLHSVDWLIPATEVKRQFSMKTMSSDMPRISYSAKGNETCHKVCLYRDNKVWCRVIDGPAFTSAQRSWADFIRCTNQRKSIKHSNIANFIGVILEKSELAIVTEHFQKGSVNQLINYRTSFLDSLLKIAFLTDIVQGLSYIHASSVKAHRSLKSPNCMVTNQLTIKLTDFGWPSQQTTDVKESLNQHLFNRLLWTAPEVLRSAGALLTQESDVYAFGIIIHEVIFATRPFDLQDTDSGGLFAAKVIESVQHGAQVPCRPVVRETEDASTFRPEIISLMQKCWAESPSDRPKISQVQEVFKRHFRLKGGNFVDFILKKLSNYAEDLEDQVAERTQNLRAEKKRSEDLLRNMLPSSVVDALIRGESTEPEIFQCATIAFTCINQFGQIIADLSPLDCVALLNEFFTLFDRLINEYDVYKVETIADSYMLASGLPVRSEKNHAEEIGVLCCAALSRTLTDTFASHTLQLQIGFHSGQVAAGLVGLRMKRYCLFGDTVNMASRMTSTSMPCRIQSSDSSRDLLDCSNKLKCEPRGEIPVKGKGMVKTFWITFKEAIDTTGVAVNVL
ncbi:atrial natriuretic peptide receptor 1-like [Paramacrobiotus metropolitanus]|uniref:atrial natriuretic peptide receptor 1-like n=1 Tax=Paramacrobiotus metropolitanus TaxID=2943436 RepID=UPI0024456182|nr:atrial natriuretic peptide receptor 1-like [Paramacrobiotus metropolitanus]